MMEQNPKIDGRTLYAGKIALAKKQISAASFRALEEGHLSLADARELGRDRGPDDTGQDTIRVTEVQDGGQEAPRSASTSDTDAPQGTPTGPRLTSRISKNDRSRPCIACGEMTTGSRFHQGCDMKMFRMAREHLTEGRELTEEQREYLEESGKLERVRARLAGEERKRQEKEQRKAERAAKRNAEGAK